ncbi:DNA polymerase/3'-5' exonuclease PolX [Candidatus Woesearchaeota archaeon]|nr:MAG: DNA polymerase/3'-5' exonuclease PolX [Candidatus Woesearchaeota archaeon]
MKNAEVAKILLEIADLLEVKGVAWKPEAYRRAARTVEGLGEAIEDVYTKGGVKALKGISGVGESIAAKIEEYLKTGRVRELARLEKKAPKGVDELLHVPGVGPKKALVLAKKLNIAGLKGLEAAAKAGKVRLLAGFGKKSEEDILRGLEIVKKGKSRKLLGLALPLAREFAARLERLRSVEKAVPAGSVRRMKETVGDIDVLVLSRDAKKVMDFFTAMPEVQHVLARGGTRSSVVLKDGLQADVRVLEPNSFGAALQYFTGSKEHNVALRRRAIMKGFKLSEYGLFKGKKWVAGRAEEDIYRKLNLSYIPPELRENQGEIEAAVKGKLPKLVERGDIRGDLHMHSVWSDGVASIEEMARAAKQRGYEYIAMTDHSKSERIANGMDEKRLLRYLEEIERVERKVGIRILKGSEVDILPDGSLDYADSVLEKLDIVLAGVHSRFKSAEKEMTTRICAAVENRYVNVLVHPTGRIINQREGYAVDLDAVMAAAGKNKVALEIDAYPSRLDLTGENVRRAIESGCLIAIDTDSHAVEHLRSMELGVGQARRGWAEAKSVINTFPLRKLEKFLRKK